MDKHRINIILLFYETYYYYSFFLRKFNEINEWDITSIRRNIIIILKMYLIKLCL